MRLALAYSAGVPAKTTRPSLEREHAVGLERLVEEVRRDDGAGAARPRAADALPQRRAPAAGRARRSARRAAAARGAPRNAIARLSRCWLPTERWADGRSSGGSSNSASIASAAADRIVESEQPREQREVLARREAPVLRRPLRRPADRGRRQLGRDLARRRRAARRRAARAASTCRRRSGRAGRRSRRRARRGRSARARRGRRSAASRRAPSARRARDRHVVAGAAICTGSSNCRQLDRAHGVLVLVGRDRPAQRGGGAGACRPCRSRARSSSSCVPSAVLSSGFSTSACTFPVTRYAVDAADVLAARRGYRSEAPWITARMPCSGSKNAAGSVSTSICCHAAERRP